MDVRERLIQVLADGAPHSGSQVAAALEVTRSAVWKQVHRLGEFGLDVIVERGRGYRLARPLDLLDAALILRALDAGARAACECLDVQTITDSTNLALAAQPVPSPGTWRAVLAEFQTGGRGRRGRRWLSPLGSGLCLSMSWCFASTPRDFPSLSLAAGIAVRRALDDVGCTDVALKWPNDVVHAGAKLAGILVDVDGDARGPLRAIVGVGLNVTAPQGLVRAVHADGGLVPGSIEQACGGSTVSRNALAAALIGRLSEVLREFPERGFAPLAGEWHRHDYLCGREVTVTGGAHPVAGVARGIASDGALRVEGPEGMTTVLGGDVTLRAGT